VKRYSINVPVLAALTMAARHLSRVITRAAGSRYVPTAPLLTCGTRAARAWRRAHVRITPPVRLTWRVMTLDAFEREARSHADARRIARAARAASLRTYTTYATCDTCGAPHSVGDTCDHAGWVPVSRPKPLSRHAAAREARALIRMMRDTTRRERDAQVSRRTDAMREVRDAHVTGLRSRGDRARARYLASLTPEQRTMLDALRTMPIESVDALAERHTPRHSYATDAPRGVTSAREARVTARGATGDPAHAARVKGHAARVTTRDAHAATASDEWRLAATTVAPIETVGTATHPFATGENYATLIDAVRRDPARATVTVTRPGPNGRMRHVRPVTDYTTPRDEARAAAREARAAHVAAALARVRHATRHVVTDESHAARYARLSRAGVNDAATLDA